MDDEFHDYILAILYHSEAPIRCLPDHSGGAATNKLGEAAANSPRIRIKRLFYLTIFSDGAGKYE